MWSGIILDFWSFCLSTLNTGNAGMYHHAQFVWCYTANPRPRECWASTLPTGQCTLMQSFESIFLSLLLKILCSTVLSTCIHVHYMRPWYLWRPEVGVQSPGTPASDVCELCVGAGNGTCVLCKSSRCSNSQSCHQPKHVSCFLAW